MSSSSLNLLLTTTLSRQQHSETYDDTRSSCNVDSNDSNTVVEANSIPAPLSAASPAPSRISPSPAPPTINGGIWTKHVTQRIDARTNYDCFTGTVDAITGHLLHGTMIYRRTGDVYEGPFITKYVTSSKKKSYNNNNQDGRCYYGEGTAGIKGDVIIALSHGMDGMCRYSNGMTFEGAFEDDRPKAGKWTGGEGGWTYDGQLVGVDNNLLEENHVGVGVMRTSLLLPSTSIGNRNRGSNRPKVIGIPHTLPGSVVFHGSGQFARPDGLVYQGDFLHGLANGVGKETSAHGRGVYHGEFFDGLRHGVGTLMEDYEEDSGDGAGLEGDCDCGCEEDVDERLHDQQEQVPLGDEFLSRLEDADNVISSTETDDSASPLEDNNDVDRQQSNHGPDFAAGGPQGAQTPISRSCRQCNPHPSRQQQRTKIKKKRYSSGVWCAGQCEIEDCRGTVHPESNEFMEDASSACASTIATSSLASGKSVLNDSFSSLNRTTWDMLDEKWLGI